MPTRRWLAAGLFLALIACPVRAQDAKPVKLEWKFEKDKTFYQTVTTDVTQTLKIGGRDVTQKNAQTFFLAWTPIKQEDRNWVVKLKVEGARLELDRAGTKVVYDSTKEDNPTDPLTKFFKELTGAELTLTLNPELQATTVEGREKLVEALVKADPQLETTINQVLSRDNLKQIAEATFPGLPTKEVKKGDTWTRSGGLVPGPVGAYETKYTYTNDGPQKDANVDKISVKAELTYRSSDTFSRFPFKVTGTDALKGEGSGTLDFRKDKGRADKSELKLTFKGKFKIDSDGTPTEVEVTRTQTTTVTTSDDNPVKKK